MKASEVLVHVVQKQQLGNTEDWVLHEVICANELGQFNELGRFNELGQFSELGRF